ncbi:MAG TPA: LD-carboxypeptidase [Bacteroidetes bacterium]|nr:LD-carboxypeptidase [Bacteroidota bacterium]
MISPEYLQPGMKAGVMAPARKVAPEEMYACMETLQHWGLEPVAGSHLYAGHGQFAGTDRERLADLQDMLDNPDIRLILFARGGYGTTRLLRYLDFSSFMRSPKWLAGFSDITALHSHLQTNLHVESIHASMALHFGGKHADPEGVESLRKVLFGEPVEYRWEPHPLNRIGTCRGILCGGNLSVLYSLRGTSYDLLTGHRILFLEDVDEYLYHIDRMMNNLWLGNRLDSLKGLIAGGFDRMHDNETPFGKNAENIVAGYTEGSGYPVSFGFPAGHCRPNLALILGRTVEMEVAQTGCRLRFMPPHREVSHG